MLCKNSERLSTAEMSLDEVATCNADLLCNSKGKRDITACFNPGSGPDLFQVTLSTCLGDTVQCLLTVFNTEAMYDFIRHIK